MRDRFALPLDETLAPAELDALWGVVREKQSEWVAAERRKHAKRVALAIAAASVVASILINYLLPSRLFGGASNWPALSL